MNDESFDQPPEEEGLVRLFPLPNFVLFPGAIQPLHIFEPRYRELMKDALDSDRLITMALLQPGWEEEYHENPPIYPTVCVGRIYQEELLPEGRYNLLLRGQQRAKIIEEIESDTLYRMARVKWINEDSVPEEISTQTRPALLQVLSDWATSREISLTHLDSILEAQGSLGAVADILAFALPLPLELKQKLLGEACVLSRVETLLRTLRETTRNVPQAPVKFPPDFSAN